LGGAVKVGKGEVLSNNGAPAVGAKFDLRHGRGCWTGIGRGTRFSEEHWKKRRAAGKTKCPHCRPGFGARENSRPNSRQS
jgi:hypothetical protein